MSKHNNNLSPSMSARCYCGRYITIGEEKNTYLIGSYTCPDCKHQEFLKEYCKPISSEDYYAQFKCF